MSQLMQEDFLREAIRLSQHAVEMGAGGPFGALIVRQGAIVSRGWNRVTSTSDPTAHAEIVAIREACRSLATFSLAGCEIYSSCEPCPMCLGAIHWARLERLWYAASRQDAAAAGFDDRQMYEQFTLPPDQRRLPIQQALRAEAQVAFQAWLGDPRRIPY
jgi:tRNA(Arg) A34 adenosine deaminase TadA